MLMSSSTSLESLGIQASNCFFYPNLLFSYLQQDIYLHQTNENHTYTPSHKLSIMVRQMSSVHVPKPQEPTFLQFFPMVNIYLYMYYIYLQLQGLAKTCFLIFKGKGGWTMTKITLKRAQRTSSHLIHRTWAKWGRSPLATTTKDHRLDGLWIR